MKSIEMRGVLTPEIKEKAEKHLGREFTQKELRLYPYLQYCCINSEPVDRRKIDAEEQNIIELLESEQRLVWDYASHILPTRAFWSFLCDIVADGYVERLDEEEEK